MTEQCNCRDIKIEEVKDSIHILCKGQLSLDKLPKEKKTRKKKGDSSQ
jgi:hypothetical protein